MVVKLGPELERRVKALVASGRFRSETEVIEEGLSRLLEDQALIEELEAKIDRALDDVANGRTHSPEEARGILRQHRKARAAKCA